MGLRALLSASLSNRANNLRHFSLHLYIQLQRILGFEILTLDNNFLRKSKERITCLSVKIMNAYDTVQKNWRDWRSDRILPKNNLES